MCGLIKLYEIAITVECVIFWDLKMLEVVELFVKRSAGRHKILCILSVISTFMCKHRHSIFSSINL